MNDQETKPNFNSSHSDTIKRTMYDTRINTGYLTFCKCKVGRTDNLISRTNYSILCDLDETGTHVVGLEILGFPTEGFRRSWLDADLSLSHLSTEQKAAVTQKLIQNYR